MHVVDYIILGIVQGLTEFIPVSSSGHLVLLQHWLGFNPPGVTTEIALHVATLLSVLIVYWRDILGIFARRQWAYIGYLALGTVVTVAIALPFKDKVESLTEASYAPKLVGAMLVLTCLWLLLADYVISRSKRSMPISWFNAAVTGVAQALAVLPGISRSGATIGALVQARVPREEAARFSFLLSVPVILGAALVQVVAAPPAKSSPDMLGLGIGFGTALLCGVAAIYIVLWMLKRARLSVFAAYCALLGLAAIVWG